MLHPEPVFGRVREGAFDAKASSRNIFFRPRPRQISGRVISISRPSSAERAMPEIIA